MVPRTGGKMLFLNPLLLLKSDFDLDWTPNSKVLKIRKAVSSLNRTPTSKMFSNVEVGVQLKPDTDIYLFHVGARL